MNAVAFLIGIVISLLSAALWFVFCYWLGGGIGVLIGIGICSINAACKRST